MMLAGVYDKSASECRIEIAFSNRSPAREKLRSEDWHDKQESDSCKNATTERPWKA